MKINKKFIAIGAVIAVIAIALIGYFFWPENKVAQLSPAEEIEAQLQKLIADNLENWGQYVKTTDANNKKFGNDASCGAATPGNEDFLRYEKQAQEGDVYKLDLTNGAYVIYTPNYNNWDNATLHSLGVKDLRVCSGGWLTPLYAYDDKVVWGNIQCVGAEEGWDFCLKITQAVMGFFLTKNQ